MWVDLTVFDGFVGNDFPFRVGCDLSVRTGVGVLHAAAQLEEDLIQRIGSPLLQLGSNGGIGLLPQGGALLVKGVQLAAQAVEAMFLSYWFSSARLAERTPSSYRSTWMRLLA